MKPLDFLKALAVYKNTFNEARMFLLNIFKTKEKVLEFEKGELLTLLNGYTVFIESKNINMLDALNYCHYNRPELSFYDLQINTIIVVFKMIENNNVNFNVF
jgi:hypothetical protein